jgi:ABC-type branched-subunit amino acid transport system substrate-binding protein/predicted small lipoprotein YifL
VGRRIRAIAVLVLLASAAAACGSRLPDDALARIDAQQAGTSRSADDQATTDGSTDGGATGDPAVAADPGATTGGAAAETTDGSGASTATGGGGAATGAACRGGATAKGVTATEIKVGAIVTASGPLPGATEGSYRGAQAYLTKINAAGGVCGRKLTLVKGDDGLDPQRARSEFLRIEPQVFAMVGGFSVADSGFADLVRSTQIPYIGSMVDPAGRGPNVLPNAGVGVTHTGPFQYYKNAYPNVHNVGFLYADVGGVRANTPSSREALKRVGFNIVYDSGLSSISPDFTSDVITMRDKGVQMVYLFAFEVNMHVRIARNMRQQNFEPPLKVSQIGYNSKLIELLGDTANGWTNHIDYLPMLNADEPARSPQLADFLSWSNRVAPGASLDLFPVSGWGAGALFVEALRALGPDLTRPRLLEALRAINRYDGGGIHAPLDPETGISDGCFIIVRVTDRKWVREHPASGFDCSLGERYKYG